MKDFRELKVWQKAHKLTLEVYKGTRRFPKEELYGLTNQIRRASCSISANVAEGCGRKGDADFARFLQIAMGSASELEYHLMLAHDLKLFDSRTFDVLVNNAIEVKRMLASFIKKLKSES